MTRGKTDAESHIEDFKKLEKLLTKKHGSPAVHLTKWKDVNYGNSRSALAQALREGKVKLINKWNRGNNLGTIEHELSCAFFSKKSYVLIHRLSFLSPNYGEIKKQLRSK